MNKEKRNTFRAGKLMVKKKVIKQVIENQIINAEKV